MRNHSISRKKTNLNYKKTKKKKNIRKYQSQTGGADVLEDKSFKDNCLKIMKILLPTPEPEPEPDYGEQYDDAERKFKFINDNYNKDFFLDTILASGHIFTFQYPSAKPGESYIQKYSGALHEKITHFEHLGLARNICFIKSHSSFNKKYFKLPPNIAVCFLTGVNKYAFTEFPEKSNMFHSKNSLETRTDLFKSIYEYHQNYFDKSEFKCALKSQNKRIALDYFRESTWYFPGQLCSDSIVYMSRKEFMDKRKYFGVDLVTEDDYLLKENNSYLEDYFSTPENNSINVGLEKFLDSSKLINQSQKYILILDGCRMFDYRNDFFENQSKYNFIHYQINYQLCQKKLHQDTIKFMEIPDFISSSRPRDILKQFLIKDDLKILEKEIKYNYFSFNNHLINYLDTQIEIKSEDEVFIKYIQHFLKTLNYHTILAYAKKIKAEHPDLLNKIFTSDIINYKFADIILLFNKIMPIEDGNITNFNSNIITSLAKRFQSFRMFSDLIQSQGLFQRQSRNLPNISDNYFLIYNILTVNNQNQQLKDVINPNSNIYIVFKLKKEETINKAIQLLNSKTDINKIIFYDFSITIIKKISLLDLKVDKLLLLYSNFNLNSINPICKELTIKNHKCSIGVLNAHVVEKLTIMYSVLKNFFPICNNLTSLILHINEGSTILQLKIESLIDFVIIGNTNLVNLRFNLENLLNLETIELYNLKLQTTIEFEKLTKIRRVILKDCKFNSSLDLEKLPNLKSLTLNNINLEGIEPTPGEDVDVDVFKINDIIKNASKLGNLNVSNIKLHPPIKIDPDVLQIVEDKIEREEIDISTDEYIIELNKFNF
jgi:hypothetical protein